jgi:hypothetical protein
MGVLLKIFFFKYKNLEDIIWMVMILVERKPSKVDVIAVLTDLTSIAKTNILLRR